MAVFLPSTRDCREVMWLPSLLRVLLEQPELLRLPRVRVPRVRVPRVPQARVLLLRRLLRLLSRFRRPRVLPGPRPRLFLLWLPLPLRLLLLLLRPLPHPLPRPLPRPLLLWLPPLLRPLLRLLLRPRLPWLDRRVPYRENLPQHLSGIPRRLPLSFLLRNPHRPLFRPRQFREQARVWV